MITHRYTRWLFSVTLKSRVPLTSSVSQPPTMLRPRPVLPLQISMVLSRPAATRQPWGSAGFPGRSAGPLAWREKGKGEGTRREEEEGEEEEGGALYGERERGEGEAVGRVREVEVVEVAEVVEAMETLEREEGGRARPRESLTETRWRFIIPDTCTGGGSERHSDQCRGAL